MASTPGCSARACDPAESKDRPPVQIRHGSGGIRTLSISRSEREWSASCLPSLIKNDTRFHPKVRDPSTARGGIRTHMHPILSRAARPVGVPGPIGPQRRRKPWDSNPQAARGRHPFSKRAPDPAGWLPFGVMFTFFRDLGTSVPGAGIEPAASTFRAWRHYQQQLPRSLSTRHSAHAFGKEDSNLHRLIQSQGACRLADSRVAHMLHLVPHRLRDRGFEPRLPGWKPGVVPLDQPRAFVFKSHRMDKHAPVSGRRGSRTLKARRSPDLESGAVAHRLVLPRSM